jgi:hypothetical protein
MSETQDPQNTEDKIIAAKGKVAMFGAVKVPLCTSHSVCMECV